MFLADVLSACYGKDAIDKIVFPDQQDDLRGGGGGGGPPRIDPKFVNNSELSDIQFRVEGRIFYAHKLGKSLCHQASNVSFMSELNLYIYLLDPRQGKE